MSTTFDYLTEQDRERLRALPFPVALPSAIPADWVAQTPKVEVDAFEGEEDVSFELTFSGPDSATLLFISTNGGIGDALIEDDTPKCFEHSRFGRIVVLASEDPEDPELQSDWFPEVEDSPCYHSFRGDGVSDSDLKSFVVSLELFTA